MITYVLLDRPNHFETDDLNSSTKYTTGTQPNSRIEYGHARGKFRKHFRISFDVKTNDSAGVIFYAADKENTNFVILYMESGHIVYKILSNKIIHDLQTTKTFNDGEWHKIMIVNNQSMQLMVDDNLEGGPNRSS
ncbi:Laminin G domain [Popillia japonica]|uniref:Laminin G domain n=1 Tax=Popillia japonica TaxID=7064 RepID=A0AAW1JDI9_POPJA